ncbi:MAG: tRNA pseudouridine(55) synthase TruB [Rickettsiaceae bacterium]|nr:tRNA pseudouridine(55) synthase TruB [Rickettsiaceae bacterium]
MQKINGWLCLYKPRSISSAKFLGWVKKTLSYPKIGHVGTLDPMAEGILPIAVGEATKLADLLINAEKTYKFVVKFGAKTLSGDAESDIIEVMPSDISEEEILQIIPSFLGQISQTPSKFSAIKINGRRAYDLARKGQEFEMPSRLIDIYSLNLEFFDKKNQLATFICRCSKGTYIRTLAEDIAFSLNNLGYVIELARLGVGRFNMSNCIKKPDLHQSNSLLSILEENLLPVDFVLDDILVINVTEDISNRIRNGQKITFEDKKDGFYAVFFDGVLQAIGNISENLFKIKRVFNLNHHGG